MKKTHYNWARPRPGKKYPEMGPSLTIPDQTLPMRVLMERHARGMPLDVKGGIKTPIYNNGEVPDLRNADLSEIAHMRRDNIEDIKRIREDLKNQQFAKQKAASDAQQKELENLKAEIASLKSSPKNPPIS